MRFNIVEERLEVANRNGKEEHTQYMLVCVRPYKLNHVDVA